MKKKKLRPLGQITSDLEPLYFEMLQDHDMQPHEVIGLFLQWQQTHLPQATEVYTLDGSNPTWSYYGHKETTPKVEKDIT